MAARDVAKAQVTMAAAAMRDREKKMYELRDTYNKLRNQKEAALNLHHELRMLFDRPGITPLKADYAIATAGDMMGPVIEQLEEAIRQFDMEYTAYDLNK